jgi:signal transduction histidine kinase
VFSGRASGVSLQHALEEQARRIAQALHDEAGQRIATISLAIDNLARELPAAAARLRALEGLIALVGVQLRRVVYELRPTILDHLGLVPALDALVDAIRQEGQLNVVFEAAVPQCPPSEVAIALYRIVQEAVTNALRHGGARKVWIRVHAAAGAAGCSIEDDGRGFDVRELTAATPAGLGLLGMRERVAALGGTFTIASSPGAGTEISAAIPVDSADADHGRPGR